MKYVAECLTGQCCWFKQNGAKLVMVFDDEAARDLWNTEHQVVLGHDTMTYERESYVTAE